MLRVRRRGGNDNVLETSDASGDQTATRSGLSTLAIDVGGTGLKASVSMMRGGCSRSGCGSRPSTLSSRNPIERNRQSDGYVSAQ